MDGPWREIVYMEVAQSVQKRIMCNHVVYNARCANMVEAGSYLEHFMLLILPEFSMLFEIKHHKDPEYGLLSKMENFMTT